MDIKKHAAAFVGTVAGVANGFFGAGGGSILVPGLEKFIPLETHKAHATALAVMLPLSAVSVIVYSFSGKVDVNWLTVLYVSLGGVAGGIIGAKLLSKLSAAWLNILFGLFLAAGAIRMFFA